MRSDGILGARGGGGGSDQNRATASVAVESRRRWLKRRETWLVLLGVALHAVYMLSIFDIYFKTPIVHGMDPVPPRFSQPPAKRLILLICTSFFTLLPLFVFPSSLVSDFYYQRMAYELTSSTSLTLTAITELPS